MTQKTIPVDEEYRYKLKTIALDRKMTMKALVHDWIDNGCMIPEKLPEALQETIADKKAEIKI